MIISPNDKVIYAKEQPFLYEELSSKYNCVVSFRSDSNKHCNEQLKDLFFNKSEKAWMAILIIFCFYLKIKSQPS